MTTIQVPKAVKKLRSLITQVSETHLPVKIEGKNGNGILISEDDWRAIEETLYLLSVPKMRGTIISGLKTPVGKCSEKIKW